MFPADQASYGALAKDLARKGYPVLTFNFRGYGNSGGPKNISRIALDMNAAVRFMAERVTCMVLIGASMGGTASILEGNHPKVKGVVTLSAPELKPPKLFVAAKGDVSAYESAEYFYAHATEPKEILLVEGSAHGTLLLEDPSAPLIKRKLLEFLQSSLGTACDLEPALERTAFFPGVAVYKTLVYSTY